MMLAMGRRVQPTPHLDGLLSPHQPAEQNQRPGRYGTACKQDAVVDRGFSLRPTMFRHCPSPPSHVSAEQEHSPWAGASDSLRQATDRNRWNATHPGNPDTASTSIHDRDRVGRTVPDSRTQAPVAMRVAAEFGYIESQERQRPCGPPPPRYAAPLVPRCTAVRRRHPAEPLPQTPWKAAVLA